MTLYYLLLAFVSLFGRKKPRRSRQLTVLVTGTFYSDNWLTTHLIPLANSEQVEVVKMVSIRQVPEMEKVEAYYPSSRMQKMLGEVPSRLLLFAWMALKSKPDVIAGFHLLLNGLLSVLLAKITGARSLYICGGGPREVLGGGYNTESKIFNKLKTPDTYIESILIKAVNKVDLIISMGSGAVEYFRDNGVKQRFEIVPGGFDDSHFSPAEGDKRYDLILIGRLSKIKRVDIFLQAIEIASKSYHDINAVVVGDGPDSEALQAQAKELGIADRVHFAGWQSDVAQWIQQSRIFVLTSESEGLSQALIQAMMVGLPAVVTDIGDLSDLVNSGENGYLVDGLEAEKFAENFVALLSNEAKYNQFADRAFADTRKYAYAEVSQEWDRILQTI